MFKFLFCCCFRRRNKIKPECEIDWTAIKYHPYDDSKYGKVNRVNGNYQK